MCYFIQSMQTCLKDILIAVSAFSTSQYLIQFRLSHSLVSVTHHQSLESVTYLDCFVDLESQILDISAAFIQAMLSWRNLHYATFRVWILS